MQFLLTIPWFRAEAIRIPIPEIIHGVTAIPIQPFGLLVAIGVLVGWKMADVRARRIGIAPSVVSDLVGHVLVSGFVFGHVLDAVFYHPDAIAENPLYVVELWNGLSSFGGFTGAILGAVIWRLRRKASLLAIGDAVVWAFPFGWVFGRTGCFVVHDHPGIVTTFPLAVADYHVGTPPYQTRHDLGLYEVFWSIGTIILFFILSRRRTKRGLFMALLPLAYAPIRFGLDFLRADAAQGGDAHYFGLTPGHYGSLLLFVVGLGVLWFILKRPEIEIPEWARLTATEEPSEDRPAAVPQADAPPEPSSAGAASDGPPTEPPAAA